MNTAFEIAKRISFYKQKNYTRFIVRLSIAATAISVAAILLTFSIVNGFQATVSSKLFSFWGHIQISSVNGASLKEDAQVAKKIKGERAYLIARRGDSIGLESREVEIPQFKITNIDRKEDCINVHFDVVCSKGTYIRAIARDLGKALQSGAHLIELCRTRIGDFNLSEAMTMEEIKKMRPGSEGEIKSV